MSDSVTPGTVACQAPLSMGFPRQEYWSGLPLPPVFLPGRYHGQRSLGAYSPWGYERVWHDLEGNGTSLQYSCLENPMDGGAWWAAVHGVSKSRTQLSNFTFSFHFHALEKEMATHSSVLAWRIPGTGSLVGYCLWGHTESDTTEET